MPLEILELDGKWNLKDADYVGYYEDDAPVEELNGEGWLETDVPGDIHPTLIQAGRIPDPFIDQNTKECTWPNNKSWWFTRDFDVPEGFRGKAVKLIFDGIDTYAAVYVNGSKVGQTENSFLQYSFDVTERVYPGQKNTVAVCVYATKSVIEAIDTSKYFACFYTPRIYARKAQCQFSWDWAPELPALGIWQSVRLAAVSMGVIEDVYVRTQISGHIAFNIKLDPETKKFIKAFAKKLKIRVTVRKGDYVKVGETEAAGRKNFLILNIDQPQLWWPNGYGSPELYQYEVCLLDDAGKILDKKDGRFGIREVKLVEDFNCDQTHTFKFIINGTEVFCIGANWVPASCFPGNVTDDKYERLLGLAREGYMNMIRVWGGGIYEKDVFYNLCDEYGIMVWQDLMFACSDIPDDDAEWTNKLISEFEYQVIRLRNHPSIVHWCGGNEKTGAFGEQKSHGDFVTNYLGRGVVEHLAQDVGYTSSSPYSLTDIGNDSSSGDTHGGSWEDAFRDDIELFRSYIDKRRGSFVSEFGFHGPPKLSSIKRFISQDNLWPLNGSWEHHIMDNPYSSLEETFLQVQYGSVCKIFRKPQSASDFVKLAGTFYAQYLYEEFLHHRRRKPQNAGALIWMLNDCWPAASWSVIDYYGVPKQAYYALKRASKPVVLSFRDAGNSFELYVTHNTFNCLKGSIQICLMDVNGNKKVLASSDAAVGKHTSQLVLSVEKSCVENKPNSFFVAEFKTEDECYQEIFFHNLWKDIQWPCPAIKFEISRQDSVNGKYRTILDITASKFARCVYISLGNEENCVISDNYFDILPGGSKRVVIESNRELNDSELKVLNWLEEWD